MVFRKLLVCGITLAASLPVLASACTIEPPYTPPRATILLNPAPLIVDVAAFSSEFRSNPAQASQQYSDTDLYFNVVPVEQMARTGDLSTSFVQSGGIRFVPSSLESIDNIKVGDSVDVVGRLSASEDGSIVVSGCWIKKVTPRNSQGY
jgi:hypothetical protein